MPSKEFSQNFLKTKKYMEKMAITLHRNIQLKCKMPRYNTFISVIYAYLIVNPLTVRVFNIIFLSLRIVSGISV